MTASSMPHLQRHARNVATLADETVVVPGYPGAGAALVGNILLRLGLPYLDPYTEEFDDAAGTARPAADRLDYRARLDAYESKDAGRLVAVDAGRAFVKTHLYPEDFPRVPGPVVLLVRDPRDAMYSYYNWRLGFSEQGENGSFQEFLRRPGIAGRVPADDWSSFHAAWLALPRVHVLRFEQLKTDPVAAMRDALAHAGVQVEDAALGSAVEASTFERMAVHEASVSAPGPRIMRRGLPGEWREWYDAEHHGLIATPDLQDVAGRLGYSVDLPLEAP